MMLNAPRQRSFKWRMSHLRIDHLVSQIQFLSLRVFGTTAPIHVRPDTLFASSTWGALCRIAWSQRRVCMRASQHIRNKGGSCLNCIISNCSPSFVRFWVQLRTCDVTFWLCGSRFCVDAVPYLRSNLEGQESKWLECRCAFAAKARPEIVDKHL